MLSYIHWWEGIKSRYPKENPDKSRSHGICGVRVGGTGKTGSIEVSKHWMKNRLNIFEGGLEGNGMNEVHGRRERGDEKDGQWMGHILLTIWQHIRRSSLLPCVKLTLKQTRK